MKDHAAREDWIKAATLSALIAGLVPAIQPRRVRAVNDSQRLPPSGVYCAADAALLDARHEAGHEEERMCG